MSPDPLESWRKPIVILYLISLILPVFSPVFPGAFAFLFCLGGGLFALSPFLLLIWGANPLFWLALSERPGMRPGRTAVLSVLSASASSVSLIVSPIVFIAQEQDVWEQDALVLLGQFVMGIALTSGQLAWVASLMGLAIVNVAAWWASRESRPLQVSLRAVMLVVALAAVVIHEWPWIDSVMSWSLLKGSGGGWYMG